MLSHLVTIFFFIYLLTCGQGRFLSVFTFCCTKARQNSSSRHEKCSSQQWELRCNASRAWHRLSLPVHMAKHFPPFQPDTGTALSCNPCYGRNYPALWEQRISAQNIRDPLTNHTPLHLTSLPAQNLTLYTFHTEHLSSLTSTLLVASHPNLGSVTQVMLGICAKLVLQFG